MPIVTPMRKRTRVRLSATANTPAEFIPVPNHGQEQSRRNLTIVYRLPDELRPAQRQVRRRCKGQIETLKANIERFDCVVPVLITSAGEIIDGHAIWQACKELERAVPTIAIDGLRDEEVRALRISVNRISEMAEWDLNELKAEFEFLFDFDASLVPFTAFEMPKIDAILMGVGNESEPDPADDFSPLSDEPPTSVTGDLWLFDGGHMLFCGNSRDPKSYVHLGARRAQLVFADPPYSCKIAGHASRSHGDFIEGAGMKEDEALIFFQEFLEPLVRFLEDGAIAYLCIDWRGMTPLLSAARSVGLEQKALCVWDKLSGGMGGLYRQQAEFIAVCKWGTKPHINNIVLGKHGRNRTTVWTYPGFSRFGAGRDEALAMHPTVKPLGLVVDALLDCSRPGGLVLDPFAGSGTTLLAAHRAHRVGFAIELDPKVRRCCCDAYGSLHWPAGAACGNQPDIS